MAISELREAIESEDLGRLRKVVQRGQSPDVIVDDGGWSAVLMAVDKDPQILAYLLSCGCDPNAANKRGYTPLMRASGIGSLDAMKVLLESGAHIARRDLNGMSAFDLARDARQEEAIEVLNRHTLNILADANDAQSDYHYRPLTDREAAVFFMTRRSVGGRVHKLRAVYAGNVEVDGANIELCAIALPKSRAGEETTSMRLPFGQNESWDWMKDAAHRSHFLDRSRMVRKRWLAKSGKGADSNRGLLSRLFG